jgi:hypothetical protein
MTPCPFPCTLGSMFAIRCCTRCHAGLRRSECVIEPDGLFGSEMLCPRCGALVGARLTAVGWSVVLVAAAVLSMAVLWWQSRAALLYGLDRFIASTT